MIGFTSIQIERDELASNIYSNVGIPSVNNFKHMISTNMISNCPISVADISNAEKIYGSSMASLKGKSIIIKQGLVINDDIKIPIKILENN